MQCTTTTVLLLLFYIWFIVGLFGCNLDVSRQGLNSHIIYNFRQLKANTERA